MAAIKTDNFLKVQIGSRGELRSWLEKHHSQSESIWLVTYMKNTPSKYVSRWDVLDELICFGWIDGIRRKLDEARTMQLISPRKVEHWAKSYKLRAESLIKDGLMHGSGLESIKRSKENGLWNYMDEVDNLIIPNDLQKALDRDKNSTDFFEAINDSSKRNALRWIKLAKTDQTRKKRIETIVNLSAKGEKLPGS